MDFLIELLFDLIAEGTFALSKNIKVPKYIRYPLIGIVVLFFIAVIGVAFLTGFLALEQNRLLGILLIALAFFMMFGGILKFRKTYLIRKNKE